MSDPSNAEAHAPRGASIARRILWVFGIAWLAFAVTAAFSLQALRRGAQDSERLSRGIVPVALELAQLRATQMTIAALVDGLPDERDAVAAKHVLSTLVRERNAKIASTRLALNGLESAAGSPALAFELRAEVDTAEDTLTQDIPLFDALYAALAEGSKTEINHTIVDLGSVEHDASSRLKALDGKATRAIEQVALDAKMRETRSLVALLILATATLALGVFVSLRTRAWLLPLGALTERARSVARGDLMPRSTHARDDELGQLEQSFEQMVSAVADAKDRAVTNERFAAIGKMAAHVTHEIRNPLTSIGLNLDMLEEELDEAAANHDVKNEAQKLASAIRREVSRLEQLSEEYLRLARLPSPRKGADDLVRIAEDLVQFEQPEMNRAHVKLVLDTKEVPPVLCDEGQIRQALLNLVRNAREAMNGDSESDTDSADAGAGTAPEKVVTVRIAAEGMSVVITVSDTGPGIDEALRERIFEPFFSTKGQGTGLGLAITRQILEAHGGHIRALRTPGGRGTTFRIELPFAPLATDKFEQEKLAGQRV